MCLYPCSENYLPSTYKDLFTFTAFLYYSLNKAVSIYRRSSIPPYVSAILRKISQEYGKNTQNTIFT